MKRYILTAALLFIAGIHGAFAQDVDLESYPGYVDLEEIEIPSYSNRVSDISLGPALLRMFHAFGDDEESEKMEGFLSIRVKTFDVNDEDSEKILPIIQKIEKKLNKQKWERLIRSKDEDDYTIISLKATKGKAVGLLIMSLEYGHEASFVNIVGQIDLEKISNLGMGISDSAMDSLKQHWKN